MSRPIIQIRGVSKKYRLGHIGMTSLRDDVERLGRWCRSLAGGKPAAAPREDKRDFWALRDVSFDVQPGEALGIIGRNGAGKSTLLKVLSRITEPTSGEIRLRGRVGSLLEVGTGFHPELSGRDNIFLKGAILGMTRAEVARKFDEIVAFSEVERFLDTPVKRYSSGMYVRLAFAVAAHLEPDILIVDEVLAVGDQQFQRKCLGKMADVSERSGRTVLFVSHHMTAIRRLCKRCVLLDGGRSSGPMDVDTAIEHYAQGSGASALTLDLTAAKRSPGAEARTARFKEVAVVSPGGLRFNQPFAIEFVVEARETLENMMLGLGFRTVDGQRILTLDSDGGGRTFTLPAGTSRIRLELPRLPLHPGAYQISAAIGSGRHYYDSIGSLALWEVVTSVHDHESDRSFGGCRIEPAFAISSA
ncbi:MAG TPA: ABC transporter ATP-binding protein [Opitutaceae bacterium]|nr:ABC transporter ATP-binding protein [Opitutaceae bacterium]